MEVAEVPDSKNGKGDNGKHACNVQFTSWALGILGEEDNEEAGSNNKWNKEEYAYKYVPPVDIFINKAPEYLTEDSNGKEEVEDTNTNNTALDWEASTAWEILGLFSGALTDAATAHLVVFLGFALY